MILPKTIVGQLLKVVFCGWVVYDETGGVRGFRVPPDKEIKIESGDEDGVL